MENGHSSYPVLIVDDEVSSLRSLELTLKSASFGSTIALSDSREVKSTLQRTPVDAVLLDLLMPHITGDEILEYISDTYPWIPVIIITGNDTIDTAVKCMKLGAFDYILKPVEKNRLVSAVSRAVEITRLKRENESLRNYLLDSELKNPEAFAEIKTVSESVEALFRYVESIADTPYPVLITGETGVGKELMAQAIHRVSGRRGEFVAINTAGLDENAFSDTLFGHVKGAFTGADSVRKGLIEKAAGGTLFLDEIGDLSSHLQVKLLRILQEYEYFPLGSDTARRTDARIVVATNRDLEKLMEEGAFRRDLYYRLAGHTIHIPPLRERKRDIPLLLRDFISESCLELGYEPCAVSREIEKLLMRYSFPGNIRELKMLCMNAAAKTAGGSKIDLDDFSNQLNQAYLGKRIPDTDPGELVVFPSSQLPTLKQVDTLLVKEAMKRADGVQAAAAEMLGISRQALNNRLKKMK